MCSWAPYACAHVMHVAISLPTTSNISGCLCASLSEPCGAVWICPPHPACGLPCCLDLCLPACRTVTGNNLSGSVPDSWAQLASLDRITMQPGNPDMCTGLPPDAVFKLCKAGDQLCLDQPVSNSSNCAPPPPPAPASASSFPVVAVAVPVTMVVLAAIVAAGLLWRRQRRRAQAAAAPAAGQQTGFYKASPAAPAGKRLLLACLLLQQQSKSELRVPAGRRCACPTTAVG
jgi:hypothetical protein